jgi:hypothetical protein
LARSDEHSARNILEKSLEQILAKAATIDSAEWRHSFLQRIPDHRRTIELAASMAINGVGRLSR